MSESEVGLSLLEWGVTEKDTSSQWQIKTDELKNILLSL